MGYQALCAADFENSQEPEITGELVRAMRESLERDTAPPWAEYYAIHDDPALNVQEDEGAHVHVLISNLRGLAMAQDHAFALRLRGWEEAMVSRNIWGQRAWAALPQGSIL
jgi:hypothetical protein